MFRSSSSSLSTSTSTSKAEEEKLCVVEDVNLVVVVATGDGVGNIYPNSGTVTSLSSLLVRSIISVLRGGNDVSVVYKSSRKNDNKTRNDPFGVDNMLCVQK